MTAIAVLAATVAAKGEPLNVRLARAMYNRHQQAAPAWDNMSDGFQRWMIEQADEAIRELTLCEIEQEEY